MATAKSSRLGTLELAGVGFATGVAIATASSILPGATALSMPMAALAGTVFMPAAWRAVVLPVTRRVSRRRQAHIRVAGVTA